MTGMDALVRSHISASHALHSGRPASVGDSGGTSGDGGYAGGVAEGFGRSAEYSVGEASSGVTVWDEELLGIFSGSSWPSDVWKV